MPMRKYGTCDFSFAGLKTSTRMIIEQRLRPEDVEAMDAQQLRKVRNSSWVVVCVKARQRTCAWM